MSCEIKHKGPTFLCKKENCNKPRCDELDVDFGKRGKKKMDKFVKEKKCCNFYHKEIKSGTAEINMDVVKNFLTDHGWPIFKTGEYIGDIISANIMCSGEGNPKFEPNSFSKPVNSAAMIETKNYLTEEKYNRVSNPDMWYKRYDDIVNELYIWASINKFPIICIQEFPKTNRTKGNELKNKLETKFINYNLFFGEKEGSHNFSQLLMLIPKKMVVNEIKVDDNIFEKGNQYGSSRFQIIKIDKTPKFQILINIHPGSMWPHDDNITVKILGKIAVFLFKKYKKLEKIHIVGDWNLTPIEWDREKPKTGECENLIWSDLNYPKKPSYLIKFKNRGIKDIDSNLSEVPIDLYVNVIRKGGIKRRDNKTKKKKIKPFKSSLKKSDSKKKNLNVNFNDKIKIRQYDIFSEADSIIKESVENIEDIHVKHPTSMSPRNPKCIKDKNNPLCIKYLETQKEKMKKEKNKILQNNNSKKEGKEREDEIINIIRQTRGEQCRNEIVKNNIEDINIGDKAKIFSTSNRKWVIATVKGKSGKSGKRIKVEYDNYPGFGKAVEFGSYIICFIDKNAKEDEEDKEDKEGNSKIKKGDKVEIYSNSNKEWCEGEIYSIGGDKVTVNFWTKSEPDKILNKTLPMDHKDLRLKTDEIKLKEIDKKNEEKKQLISEFTNDNDGVLSWKTILFISAIIAPVYVFNDIISNA